MPERDDQVVLTNLLLSSDPHHPPHCDTAMDFSSIRARLPHLLLVLFSFFAAAASPAAAQSQSPARILDAALQGYAYRAFTRPRTGIVYNATLPGNLTGVAASAVRLRSGSLRRRGFAGYFEFGVPTGVVVRPHVERVVLVYHDLGSRSGHYYPLPPGYAYLAPVLGLLVYDAANLSAAAGLPELDAVATGGPISVRFGGAVLSAAAGGAAPRCVVFGLDGVPQFSDLEATGTCSTYRQGHVSIVVNSSGIAPAPPPGPPPSPGAGAAAPPAPVPVPAARGNSRGSSRAWKVAASVVGAAVALGLLAASVACLVRHKRDRKLQVMEWNAAVGETLRMARVGRTQAPVASGTRTQPAIENDYVA